MVVASENREVSSQQCGLLVQSLVQMFVWTISSRYLVEVDHHADMWPPRCTCEDNYWRPDLLCKHTLVCLKLMGMDESFLSDCCWVPEQHELHKVLVEFVCVGADAGLQGDNKQMRER